MLRAPSPARRTASNRSMVRSVYRDYLHPLLLVASSPPSTGDLYRCTIVCFCSWYSPAAFATASSVPLAIQGDGAPSSSTLTMLLALQHITQCLADHQCVHVPGLAAFAAARAAALAIRDDSARTSLDSPGGGSEDATARRLQAAAERVAAEQVLHELVLTMCASPSTQYMMVARGSTTQCEKAVVMQAHPDRSTDGANDSDHASRADS